MKSLKAVLLITVVLFCRPHFACSSEEASEYLAEFVRFGEAMEFLQRHGFSNKERNQLLEILGDDQLENLVAIAVDRSFFLTTISISIDVERVKGPASRRPDQAPLELFSKFRSSPAESLASHVLQALGLTFLNPKLEKPHQAPDLRSVRGVVEGEDLKEFSDQQQNLLKQVSESLFYALDHFHWFSAEKTQIAEAVSQTLERHVAHFFRTLLNPNGLLNNLTRVAYAASILKEAGFTMDDLERLSEIPGKMRVWSLTFFMQDRAFMRHFVHLVLRDKDSVSRLFEALTDARSEEAEHTREFEKDPLVNWVLQATVLAFLNRNPISELPILAEYARNRVAFMTRGAAYQEFTPHERYLVRDLVTELQPHFMDFNGDDNRHREIADKVSQTLEERIIQLFQDCLSSYSDDPSEQRGSR